MEDNIKFNLRDWLKTIIIALIISIIIEKFFISVTIVSGESMLSTLHNDDRLIIDKVSYNFDSPRRGEVVVFIPPIKGREDELFVKRVVGVSGDTYNIEGNKIYINGELLQENYIYNYKDVDRNYEFEFGIVPKGHIYVLGDNRNNSNDSRSFGCVPVDKIKGRVLTKIWPIKPITTFSAQYPKYGDGELHK